ncbi:MAG: tRNA guanosine(34) transglycosylase Tgt [Dehalococcoidales bacterium]|nr:tRNA guanosine(34) transglycosylase Tgt [Dehalococcoidales bacterium]
MTDKKFHLLIETQARAGELITSHGTVPTPVFLPVGSQATVKTLTPDEISGIGYKMILANNYHLYLRPGIEVIKKLGGLHKFMSWEGAILTDSGGFQVFSLAPLRKVTDDGVMFRSHIDGSQHFLTPELAVEYQEALGSDVMMVLDECAPHDAGREKVAEAMHRTHRWAARCREAQKSENQSLYGIVQGGIYSDLRKQSVNFLKELDFEGYAIGGLSVGEPKDIMYSILAETAAQLPVEKPRYLMGVGSPEDIVEGVARGIDIFDCVLPTRVARNGALFTWNGRVNIRNAGYAQQTGPVMPGCGCYTCTHFSAAYLHHLFNAGELLAYRLATLHNLTFMHSLVKKVRESTIDGTFSGFYEEFLQNYRTTDEEIRLSQKQKWLKAREAKEKAE